MKYTVLQTFRDRQKGNKTFMAGEAYDAKNVSQSRLDYLQDRNVIAAVAEEKAKPVEKPKKKEPKDKK